jgi:hypothetical protein
MLTAASRHVDPWDQWTAGLHRECPSRNVEMMGDGGYLEFIYAFALTLPRATSRRFDRVADIKKQCAKEKMGFGCEMYRTLYAAQRLGLMHKIVSFGCRTVKCEEGALCSQSRGRLPFNPNVR